MNLLEAFLKLRKNNTKSWVETTATFTGKREKATEKTKVGYKELDYYEYEISYSAGDKQRYGYYSFYPLPDPETEEIKGKTIRIKYNEKKPYRFELVSLEDEV